MGIDYGDARTGVSISDPTGFLAGSPQVIASWNTEKLLDELVQLAKRERIEEIVLGLPKNMNASEGERAEKCKALGKELEARTGLPVVLWDERRTTVEAHAILHAAGKKQKKHKKNVDAVAASLILQGYLDYKRLHS
ncbi:MAG: Holliday junction resolvase RuvX [Butyricicoccus sp.]